MKDIESFVDNLISQMTLEQKVGQCFTYLWSGHLITPSIVEAIEKLHAGNLRVQPAFMSGKRHKYYEFDTAAGEYDYPDGYPIQENLLSPGSLGAVQPHELAERMNRLQQIACARPGGIPLNMALDQEGDISRNYPFSGFNLLPSAMGQAAAGDPQYVYELNKALGIQLSEMGITCLHSPVVDVNINPDNPEIGIRSYSDDPQVVAEYAVAAMKGMQDGGILATAKHFPGRGDSMTDAHFGTPVLDVPRERLDSVELLPYRALIENGLDCVMIAHNVYTALDDGVIATVSRKIVTDLLRGELGFEGVITTDAIAMGALMKQYALPEACARALEAGADLVLNKTETAYRDQGFLETMKYVKEGRIPESELDDKVRRVLTMKAKRGLFDDNAQIDVTKAGESIRNPEVIELVNEASRKACITMRDRAGLLPVGSDKKVLVIEQRLQDVYMGLDVSLHRLSFTEAVLSHSTNVVPVDTQLKATEEDEIFVMEQVEEADVIIMTNDFARGENNNTELVKKILAKNPNVILVGNHPYELSMVAEAPTCICTFSSTPACLRAAADIIFGKAESQGRWPLVNYEMG